MSWADEANAKAHTQWYNPDHGDGDCMKCQVNFQVREGFEMGAKWQRDQLHTDEAVERAAEAIYLSHDSYSFFTAKPWAEIVKSKDKANRFRVKQDRKAARAAITALLGEGA